MAVLTLEMGGATIAIVDDDEESIDAREAARMRRRDHDADAASRDLMRPGMGKVFKQVQDAWTKPAKKPSKAIERRDR